MSFFYFAYSADRSKLVSKVSTRRRAMVIPTQLLPGYYNVFPPKKANVSIASREPVPGQGARNVVILNKDVAAGEVIYTVSQSNREPQQPDTFPGKARRRRS